MMRSIVLLMLLFASVQAKGSSFPRGSPIRTGSRTPAPSTTEPAPSLVRIYRCEGSCATNDFNPFTNTCPIESTTCGQYEHIRHDHTPEVQSNNNDGTFLLFLGGLGLFMYGSNNNDPQSTPSRTRARSKSPARKTPVSQPQSSSAPVARGVRPTAMTTVVEMVHYVGLSVSVHAQFVIVHADAPQTVWTSVGR
jgi:hypothetical protein